MNTRNLFVSMLILAFVPGCTHEKTAPAVKQKTEKLVDLQLAREKAAQKKAVKKKLEEAERLMEEKKYSRAAVAWKDFLEKYSGLPEAESAHYGLANCRYHQQEYTEALVYFEKVLEKRGLDQPADDLAIIGNCMMLTGNIDGAEKIYRNLLENDRWEGTARLNLSGILLATERYAECMDMCSSFIRICPESNHLNTARYRLARCLAATGKIKEASGIAERIVEESAAGPYLVDAMLLVASCKTRLGEFGDAVGMLQAALDKAGDGKTKKLIRFHMASTFYQARNFHRSASEYERLLKSGYDKIFDTLRFRFAFALRASGRLKEAVRVFESVGSRVIEQKWKPHADYWQARCRMELGEYQAALKLLEDLAENPSPGAGRLEYDIAVCLMGKKEYEAAGKKLDAFIEIEPAPANREKAVYLRACCFHETGRYDEAREMCRKISANSGLLTAADTLVADGLFMQKKYDEAEEAFSRIAKAGGRSNPVVAIRLGQCAYLRKDFKEAAGLLSGVFGNKDIPGKEKFTKAMLALGDSLAAIGQHGQAADWYRKYVEQGGTRLHEARYRQARSAFASGDRKTSIRLLEELSTLRNEKKWRMAAVLEMAREYREAGDETEAARALERLKKMDPPSEIKSEAAFLHGLILTGKNKPEKAIEVFDSFLKRWPDHRLAGSIGYYRALCQYRAENIEEASATARKYIEDHPDGEMTFRAKMLLMRHAARGEKGDAAEAKRIFSAIQGNGNIAPCELYELARTAKDCGLQNEATEILKKLIGANTRYMLSLKIREEFADSLYKGKKFKRALKFSAEITRDSNAPLDIQASSRYRSAWCQFKMCRYKSAAKEFAAFIRDYPDHKHVPAALYQEAVALAESGRPDKAISKLEQFLDKYPRSPFIKGVFLRLGRIYNSVGQPNKAIKTFKIFLDNFKNHRLAYIAQYGTGRAMEKKKKYTEAINQYTEVIKAKKNAIAAECQYRIGKIYGSIGKYQTAIMELAITYSYNFPEWSSKAMLEIGIIYEKMGKNDKAEKAYRECIKAYPESSTAKTAVEKLRRLGKNR